MVGIVSSIAPLALGTKAWLVDIWGVMHNGVSPFSGAVDACVAYRKAGGIVVLVSNAPRPNAAVAAQLDRIGVAAHAYDAIVTSGDTSRALIAALDGRPVYHIGPERDLGLYDGLGIVPVGSDRPDEAQAIVCSGLVDDERETAETYRSLLTRFAARRLPMVCANPDLTVERGGRIIPCAGAVAALYETLGGTVDYAGKPYLPIYETAFALVDKLAGRQVAKHEILAIGDGVRTDIEGAHAAGIRSIYIASAVSLEGNKLDGAALDQLFAATRAKPIAAMEALAP